MKVKRAVAAREQNRRFISNILNHIIPTNFHEFRKSIIAQLQLPAESILDEKKPTYPSSRSHYPVRFPGPSRNLHAYTSERLLLEDENTVEHKTEPCLLSMPRVAENHSITSGPKLMFFLPTQTEHGIYTTHN